MTMKPLVIMLLVGCGGASDGFAVAADDTGTAAEAIGEASGDDVTDSTAVEAETGDPDTGATDTMPPVDSGVDAGSDTGKADSSPPDTGPEAEACVDGDGDGEGSVTCGGLDCHDGNKTVFSKQADWFDKPYTAVGGASSWDYNCSGKTELEYPSGYVCYIASDGLGCVFKKGYTGSFTPACGTAFELAVGCTRVVSDAGVASCRSYVASGDLVITTMRCH